jgi:uncharacterized protein with NAD-binding domain and iron-sulfur cluster
MKITKRNKIFIFFGLSIIIFALAVLLYRPVIFQEGNPWPEIKGIVQLKFGDNDIVKLSGSDNKFMTESKNGTMIHDFMKTKGYEFTGQMGSGYFFESATGQIAVATHRYYSRHYSLWNITETNNAKESIELADYANELKECLPKSDTASHEKCNELLKQITNYDSCVSAGFSIMKSNPPQCATPDGRTFIENK